MRNTLNNDVVAEMKDPDLNAYMEDVETDSSDDDELDYEKEQENISQDAR